LPEGVPATERLAGLGGAVQGRNDFRRIGYGGPCPPPGRAHRYVFRLFALRAALSLGPGATRQEVEHAMQGHVLAEATLMGTYARQGR
jgi:Raf kinase inhibitor-like YbhB/YbcL family protein